MKRIGFIILLIYACTPQEGAFNAPLEREVFKEALKQSLLIEARANKERIELKLDTIPIDGYYDAMFERLQVNETDFRNTYALYAEHPKAFESVFEEVAENLKQEVDSLQQLLN